MGVFDMKVKAIVIESDGSECEIELSWIGSKGMQKDILIDDGTVWVRRHSYRYGGLRDDGWIVYRFESEMDVGYPPPVS